MRQFCEIFFEENLRPIGPRFDREKSQKNFLTNTEGIVLPHNIWSVSVSYHSCKRSYPCSVRNFQLRPNWRQHMGKVYWFWCWPPARFGDFHVCHRQTGSSLQLGVSFSELVHWMMEFPCQIPLSKQANFLRTLVKLYLKSVNKQTFPGVILF